MRVWDLVTKSCAAVLDKHFSAVTSVAVSTNGWTLVSAGRDKVLDSSQCQHFLYLLCMNSSPLPTNFVINSIVIEGNQEFKLLPWHAFL